MAHQWSMPDHSLLILHIIPESLRKQHPSVSSMVWVFANLRSFMLDISRAHVDPTASTRDTGTSGSASNAPSGNRPTPFGQAQQSAATTVPSRPAQGGSGEHRRSGHHRASTAPSEQTSTSLQSLRGSSFQATAGSGKTVSHYMILIYRAHVSASDGPR